MSTWKEMGEWNGERGGRGEGPEQEQEGKRGTGVREQEVRYLFMYIVAI